MSAYKIGDRDYCGNILRKHKGPVYLWESPNGNYLIYLYVEDWRGLNTSRKKLKDAETLFDSVCNMLRS